MKRYYLVALPHPKQQILKKQVVSLIFSGGYLNTADSVDKSTM